MPRTRGKEHKVNFFGDVAILHLDCGSGYIRLCKVTEMFTNGRRGRILIYLNYTSIKIICVENNLVFYRVKHTLTYDLAILLDIYSRQLKTSPHKDVPVCEYTSTFIYNCQNLK